MRGRSWLPVTLAWCLAVAFTLILALTQERSAGALGHPRHDTDPAITTILLVRHAEKAAEPREDPPLTTIGRCRSEGLANLLSGAGISKIYSTDTRRTRDTASVVAGRLGLEVEVLPPSDLEAMARALEANSGQVVLSVGHSNTLGPLAELLGAPALAPIADDDYDGLYVVTLAAGAASVIELHQPTPEVSADGSCVPGA